MSNPTQIPQEEVRADKNRLVAACKVVIRQGESPYPIGHDAIMELHRALKKAVPELPPRKELDKLEAESTSTVS